MRNVILLASALSVPAMPAMAADSILDSFPETHRNARIERPAPNTRQIQVRAGKVLTARELQSAGLSADDLVTVTSFPTSEWARNLYER